VGAIFLGCDGSEAQRISNMLLGEKGCQERAGCPSRSPEPVKIGRSKILIKNMWLTPMKEVKVAGRCRGELSISRTVCSALDHSRGFRARKASKTRGAVCCKAHPLS